MDTCPECGREFKDKRGLRLHRCESARKGKMKTETETKTNDTTITQTVLSPEEKGIADRVASQDTSWFTLREDELTDFSLQINPLDLQFKYPEAWKMQIEKQFAFRWCERKPSVSMS